MLRSGWTVLLAIIVAVIQAAAANADAPPLLCRDIRAIPARDLVLMAVVRSFDTVVLESDTWGRSRSMPPVGVTPWMESS